MSAVSEEIVREYLELSEFTVKVHRKFLLTGSERDELDEVDIVAVNLNPAEAKPSEFLLGRGDIRGIDRAVIGVRGWHSETFSPSRLRSSPEVFNLALLDKERVSNRFFRGLPFCRVLVVSSLPATAALKQETLLTLKDKGLDHCIDFKTILEDLVDTVETHRNYAQSPTLQLLRILKRHDMLRDYQLDLF